MWGAYFCMGAYKRRCGLFMFVVCCIHGFMNAYFLWVRIIPILRYLQTSLTLVDLAVGGPCIGSWIVSEPRIDNLSG